ncbi:MAG: hypothetical protein E7112_03905 [Bacteroidales bacterium]|nr:hypothetical protein [Bacteroidales bacterium]
MNKSKKSIIFGAVTVIMAVTVLVLAGYIMFNRLGLVEGYDFGIGAYYYVDIPDFEKIVDQDAFNNKVPMWVYITLFIAWGWLMWRLWLFIDKKSSKDNGEESEHREKDIMGG